MQISVHCFQVETSHQLLVVFFFGSLSLVGKFRCISPFQFSRGPSRKPLKTPKGWYPGESMPSRLYFSFFKILCCRTSVSILKMNAKNFYTFPTSNYPSTFGYISCFIYDYPIFPSEKTSISRLLAAETRPKLSGEGTWYGATPWFTLFGRNQLEKTKEKNANDAHGSFHERTSLILGKETTGILLGGWHKQLSLYINLPYPSISTVSRIPRIKGQ